MTAVEVTLWALECDVTDCAVRSDADGRGVWLTRELAEKEVSQRDRFLGFSEDSDGKHYCSIHSGFCEVCDDRKPLHELVQDEEEGWWQCRRHLTEPDRGAAVGLRARLRQLQGEGHE